MNIVHIEDFFHPDAGYQVNILAKFMARQGHEVTVITGELDKIPDTLTAFFRKENIEAADAVYTEKTGVKIIRIPLIGYVSGRVIFSRKIYKVVRNLNPDILYVHGNDTLSGMCFSKKLKSLECPLVMDNHMLEMASHNRFSHIFRALYRTFFAPIIIKNSIPVIRTVDDPYVEKCLGIPLKQCPVIGFGSDVILFKPDEYSKATFRKENDISANDFVVLYAGKLDESKGGKILANAFAKKFECQNSRNVTLIVVGNTVGDYGKEIEEIFSVSENRIIRFPTQKYMDLAKFYQAADLAVFPKQCSLSFFDVQACGLPVLAEDNKINEERLSNNNGLVFKSNNIADFRTKVMHYANMQRDEYNIISDNAYNLIQSKYNYEKIAQQYITILQNVFKEKGEN